MQPCCATRRDRRASHRLEHLRAKEDEPRKVKEFLVEYVEWVEQLRENRDEWQREAERRSAVMGQVPHWALLWARGRLNVSGRGDN